MQEFETRPWGDFKVLSETKLYKIKQITVTPGHRLSLQSHRYRSEHWYVIQGTAETMINGNKKKLIAGEAIDIPIGAVHRVANVGNAELVFIEIQTGTSFEETDIKRYEDDFGRK